IRLAEGRNSSKLLILGPFGILLRHSPVSIRHSPIRPRQPFQPPVFSARNLETSNSKIVALQGIRNDRYHAAIATELSQERRESAGLLRRTYDICGSYDPVERILQWNPYFGPRVARHRSCLEPDSPVGRVDELSQCRSQY